MEHFDPPTKGRYYFRSSICLLNSAMPVYCLCMITVNLQLIFLASCLGEFMACKKKAHNQGGMPQSCVSVMRRSVTMDWPTHRQPRIFYHSVKMKAVSVWLLLGICFLGLALICCTQKAAYIYAWLTYYCRLSLENYLLWCSQWRFAVLGLISHFSPSSVCCQCIACILFALSSSGEVFLLNTRTPSTTSTTGKLFWLVDPAR